MVRERQASDVGHGLHHAGLAVFYLLGIVRSGAQAPGKNFGQSIWV